MKVKERVRNRYTIEGYEAPWFEHWIAQPYLNKKGPCYSMHIEDVVFESTKRVRGWTKAPCEM